MWAIQTIIIHKPIGFKEAKKIASDIIRNPRRKFFVEKKDTFHFRNLPKTKFNEFRSKRINDYITLVVGRLKPEFSHMK